MEVPYKEKACRPDHKVNKLGKLINQASCFFFVRIPLTKYCF